MGNSEPISTVHDAISVYGGDSEPNTPGPTVRINHITVHRSGHYGLNLKFVDNTEVKNSILTDNLDFVDRTGKTLGGPWLSDQASVSHCDTLNVGGGWTGGRPTASSIYALDPMFADPENLDFSVQKSDLSVLSEDGGPLGDLRWAQGGTTSVEDEPTLSQTPETFFLDQNYPNPFNPVTTIRYTIAENSHVKLRIFNLKGELVETLVDDERNAGEHSASWEASVIASGVYFYKLTAGAEVTTKKMTLLR